MKSRSEEKNRLDERRGFFSRILSIGLFGIGLISVSLEAKGSGKIKTLTETQKKELFFIYEEEKMARDVYITLGELYPNENTFASIQLSEQRHMDAAEELCEKYGVDISMVDESLVGFFNLTELQELYDELVDQGKINLYGALESGIYIEELDIGDLTELIEETGMPTDVVKVYENLREGSYNHLESFQTAISRVKP